MKVQLRVCHLGLAWPHDFALISTPMDPNAGTPVTLTCDAARIVVSDRVSAGAALARTAHLGIGAHPDDLEIMTWKGISAGLHGAEPGFTGVVVADGADSPRSGPTGGTSNEAMRDLRFAEQVRAAKRGRYAALVYLGYASADFKGAMQPTLVADLRSVIAAARPEVIYTHNPCDIHDTHVAVVLHVVEAIRALPAAERPERLYGCEVWGSLDWLSGSARADFDVSASEELGLELVRSFTSQIDGNRRYDEGAIGRRRANAVFSSPHAVATPHATELAVDMSPLLHDPPLDVHEFVMALWDEARETVSTRLRRFG